MMKRSLLGATVAITLASTAVAQTCDSRGRSSRQSVGAWRMLKRSMTAMAMLVTATGAQAEMAEIARAGGWI